MKKNKIKCYVLIVSRTFPKNHFKAGQKTNFVENIIKIDGAKLHTLRNNFELWQKRFKEIEEGNAYLSLRYWDGLPYKSPQTEFAKLRDTDGIGLQKLSFMPNIFIDDLEQCLSIKEIAQNDGLDFLDFKEWFGEIKHGQEFAIIHFTKFRYEKNKN